MAGRDFVGRADLRALFLFCQEDTNHDRRWDALYYEVKAYLCHRIGVQKDFGKRAAKEFWDSITFRHPVTYRSLSDFIQQLNIARGRMLRYQVWTRYKLEDEAECLEDIKKKIGKGNELYGYLFCGWLECSDFDHVIEALQDRQVNTVDPKPTVNPYSLTCLEPNFKYPRGSRDEDG